jgi:arylsulfatase A-like enzyme
MAGADKSVGIVIDALKAAGIFEDTLVIISADHGGSGKSHGKDDPRSRYIPWIAVGPGIRKNLDLTSYRELTVHTEDTFATACRFLGLPMPEGTQGKPIRQMMAANTPPAAAKASSSQPAMAQ